MTTVFLLTALAMACCFTALVGGTLLLIGLLGKKRAPRRAGTALLVSSLLIFAGCFVSVSAKVAHKLKHVRPKEYVRATVQAAYESIVNAAFDDTDIQPLAPAEARKILIGKLAPGTFLNEAEVQGAWVEGAVLSCGYFLYTADEKELLQAIASAPVDPSFHVGSDTECRKVTWDELRGGLLTYQKGPQRNLPGWNLDAVEDKRCYRCLRSPWAHEFVIDGKTGKVFHAISEIRD